MSTAFVSRFLLLLGYYQSMAASELDKGAGTLDLTWPFYSWIYLWVALLLLLLLLMFRSGIVVLLPELRAATLTLMSVCT